MAITADKTSTKGRVSGQTNGSVSTTFGTRPTVGSIVVVIIWSWASAGATHGTCSDNQGNTYANVATITVSTSQRLTIYVGTATTSAGTFTNSVAITGSSVSAVVVAQSFNSCTTTLDVAAKTNTGTSSTPGTGNTANTTQADCVAISGMNINGAGGVGSVTETGTGYSLIGEEEDGNTYQCGSANYKILTGTGIQSDTWSFNASNPWCAALVVLRGVGGGSTFTQTLNASLTPAGAITKQTNKGLTAASIAPSGSIVKQTNKSLTSAGMTPSGSLSANSAFAQTLTAGLTFAGSIVKQTGKGLSAGLTFAGSTVKTTSKFLSGGMTPAGSLQESFTTAKTLTSAAVSFSGSLATQFIPFVVSLRNWLGVSLVSIAARGGVMRLRRKHAR